MAEEQTLTIKETRQLCERKAAEKKKEKADKEENCYRDMHRFRKHNVAAPLSAGGRDNYETIFGHE
jgi:hypothetical protein